MISNLIFVSHTLFDSFCWSQVDTEMVGKALAGNISNGLRSGAQGVVGIGLMTYLSPKLASVFLMVVPPIGLATWFYGQTIKRLSRQTQTALAEGTSKAEETLSNIYSVKVRSTSFNVCVLAPHLSISAFSLPHAFGGLLGNNSNTHESLCHMKACGTSEATDG